MQGLVGVGKNNDSSQVNNPKKYRNSGCASGFGAHIPVHKAVQCAIPPVQTSGESYGVRLSL